MNVLIVDDDVYVVEALRRSVPWGSIGIGKVYYAYSVERAKKLLSDEEIHILISDIEMPKENGFVLLAWVREQKLIIQEILLTMYAEFDYARQALQYNCSAYALKPIDYAELTRLIEEAMEKERRALEAVSNVHYSNLWIASEKKRKEYFFLDMVRDQPVDASDMYEVDYRSDDRIRLFMFRVFEGQTDLPDDSMSGMEEWKIKSLLTGCFSARGIETEVVFAAAPGHMCAVVRETFFGADEEGIEAVCGDFFALLLEKYGEQAGAYVTKSERICDFPEVFRRLEHFVRHSVVEAAEVFYVRDYMQMHGEYKSPDMKRLARYFADGQKGLLENYLNEYMGQMQRENRISPGNLQRLILDIEHMCYMELSKKGVSAYEKNALLFAGNFLRRGRINVGCARDCIAQMIGIAERLLRENTGEKSIVDEVVAYINENLECEMTRESLAESVYLNADYLARIFKKKTGESIGNYIQERRMERALEYLQHSDVPVNMVAVKCGYDNFSYFSKVFKSRTGLTPKEYRKEHGQ